MPLSFPSNPTLNQTSTQNGRVYQWSGYAWELAATSGGGGGGSGGGSSSLVYGATALAFPGTGSADNLYCAKDTNKLYRWDTDESAYIEVGPVGGGGVDLSPYFLPPAPTNLTAIAGNAQVGLSWTAPSATYIPPITDYVVQYSSNGGSTWATFADGTSTATSATVTGLTNGTAYVFRVAAVNGVGIGAYTSASSAATPGAGGVTVISGAASGSGTNTITATAQGNLVLGVPSTRTVTWTGSPAQYIAGPQQAGFDFDSEVGWYRNFVGNSFLVIAGTYTIENTQANATLTFTPVS